MCVSVNFIIITIIFKMSFFSLWQRHSNTTMMMRSNEENIKEFDTIYKNKTTVCWHLWLFLDKTMWCFFEVFVLYIVVTFVVVVAHHHILCSHSDSFLGNDLFINKKLRNTCLFYNKTKIIKSGVCVSVMKCGSIIRDEVF